MKSFLASLTLFSALLLASSAVLAQPLIIDHTCCDLSLVPTQYIIASRDCCRVTYGHTSHGSQIVSGMNVLVGLDTLYDWYNDNSHYRYGSGSPAPDDELSLWDYIPAGDLGAPDRVTWSVRTRVMLSNSDGAYVIYPHFRNVVMWSWCGQAATSAENITIYLTLMDSLEREFPNVTFVYMTGHLDGSGEGGTLNLRNEQIRAFCHANNKVLFDFADIESYDPDGDYFLNLGANDNCDYSGGNWAQQWCAEHPGDPLCLTCSCAHSQSLNCNRKARAFWWMMARLSGWNPDPEKVENLIVTTDGDNITLTWSAFPGAVSYTVYYAADLDGPYSLDVSGTFNGASWTAPLSADKRFYYVTAEVE
ncbi:hypothetical protein EHM69_04975 [candidate division KSB1 bacterium]|nr:MAG: hypothetical protein EHM69_04975 [candidate division KSB1 bacterium]